MVSAIVSKGEVPGLFTTEELDALVAPLADLARTEDFQGTLEQYLYHRTLKFHSILKNKSIEDRFFFTIIYKSCASIFIDYLFY